MTLLQLLTYAVLTSTAATDSQRMSLVTAWTWRDQPSLTLVCAGQNTAPVTPWGEE